MMTLAMPQEFLACWPYTMRVARGVVRRNHDIGVPHWIGSSGRRCGLSVARPARAGRDLMTTEALPAPLCASAHAVTAAGLQCGVSATCLSLSGLRTT